MALNIGSGIKTFDPLAIKRNRFEGPNSPDKRQQLADSLNAQNDAAALVANGGQQTFGAQQNYGYDPYSTTFSPNPNFYPNAAGNGFAPVVQTAGFGQQNDGFQYDRQYDAGLGKYLREVPDPDPNSIYLQCYYRADVEGQPEVMRLCEKIRGCCSDNCCPLDYQRLGGMWVLIAFVIIFAIVALIIAGVCFARSRARSRKQDQYQDQGYAASAVGSQAGYPYADSGYGPKY